MGGSHPGAKSEAGPLPGALRGVQLAAAGLTYTAKTRTKPMFTPNSQPSCALFNRVLPPIDLPVRYGAYIISCLRRPAAGSAAARARTAAAALKRGSHRS